MITKFCVFKGKYHDLERQLIQEFTAAQRRGEIGRMREVAAVLLHFKVTWKYPVWCIQIICRSYRYYLSEVMSMITGFINDFMLSALKQHSYQ